jgi:hypothetical protein
MLFISSVKEATNEEDHIRRRSQSPACSEYSANHLKPRIMKHRGEIAGFLSVYTILLQHTLAIIRVSTFHWQSRRSSG